MENPFPLLLKDPVFRCRGSPSGRHLVALHASGNISIWHLPALTFQKIWALSDHPAVGSAPNGKDDLALHPIDIHWWNETVSHICSSMHHCP